MDSGTDVCAVCRTEIASDGTFKGKTLAMLRHLKTCRGFSSEEEREETIEMVLGLLELLGRAVRGDRG